MIPYQLKFFARESRVPVTILFCIALVLHYFALYLPALLCWLVIAVTLYLYRDPTRKVPPSPLGIIAPVDGTIRSIEKVRNQYLDREAIRISIHNHLLGTYTVRSPMEGKVTKQWFDSLPPEAVRTGSVDVLSGAVGPAFAQWNTSDEGDNVVFSLSPRFRLKAARFLVHSGERIGQGQRQIFIPFGAHADVYIPANSRVEVKENDTVKSGSSIIASLVRQQVVNN